MKSNKHSCPICNNNNLTLKYESTFIYSYLLDSDEPGRKNSDEFLSFLYDKREQKSNHQYIECCKCGTKYPYSFISGVLNKSNEKAIF